MMISCAPVARANSVAWRTASPAVSEPSVPTMMRSNKTRPPSIPVSRRILSPPKPMPPTWRYLMIICVACLLASMVIAVVKLTSA